MPFYRAFTAPKEDTRDTDNSVTEAWWAADNGNSSRDGDGDAAGGDSDATSGNGDVMGGGNDAALGGSMATQGSKGATTTLGSTVLLVAEEVAMAAGMVTVSLLPPDLTCSSNNGVARRVVARGTSGTEGGDGALRLEWRL